MYCVIQKIENRKCDKYGHRKYLTSNDSTITINDITTTNYYYIYSEERFERPIKTAYKITLHQSYREDGKVKKKQYCICTIDYYSIAQRYFSEFDIEKKVKKISEETGVTEKYIYDLFYKKYDLLEEQIVKEFEQSEEYITHQKHERIIKEHHEKEKLFNETYGNYYNQIYDVFGNLMNEPLLKKVQAEHGAHKEYEQRSYQHQREYRNNYSSYYEPKASNHSETEKEVLKQFYRTLSKKYHPDSNPDKDTSEEMKILNQLKGNWGI